MVQKQLLSSMRSFGFVPGSESGTEEQLAKAITAGLPDRIFVWKGRREWYYQEGNYSNEVCLGRESSIRPSHDPIVAWGIIEIPTRSGSMRLVTNAANVVPVQSRQRVVMGRPGDDGHYCSYCSVGAEKEDRTIPADACLFCGVGV